MGFVVVVSEFEVDGTSSVSCVLVGSTVGVVGVDSELDVEDSVSVFCVLDDSTVGAVGLSYTHLNQPTKA